MAAWWQLRLQGYAWTFAVVGDILGNHLDLMHRGDLHTCKLFGEIYTLIFACMYPFPDHCQDERSRQSTVGWSLICKASIICKNVQSIYCLLGVEFKVHEKALKAP